MATGRLVVDGNNVIGAVADGWWRDRPAAVLRLLARLRCYASSIVEPVVVVLDAAQPDLPEGVTGGVVVRYADRAGRDAADDRILRLLDDEGAGGVEVVTSDRALAEAARARGAATVGAGAFLGRLDAAGC